MTGDHSNQSADVMVSVSDREMTQWFEIATKIGHEDDALAKLEGLMWSKLEAAYASGQGATGSAQENGG